MKAYTVILFQITIYKYKYSFKYIHWVIHFCIYVTVNYFYFFLRKSIRMLFSFLDQLRVSCQNHSLPGVLSLLQFYDKVKKP